MVISSSISSVIRSESVIFRLTLTLLNSVPSASTSSLWLLLCRPMVTLLAPMPDMESNTEVLKVLPSVMMAMTDAIPMMMPSMVRKARDLLERSASSARRMFSSINISILLSAPP